MNLGYDGQVALVTGGTRGIGRAIAQALLDEDCRVVVAGRRSRSAEDLVELFPGAGDAVVGAAGDTADPATAAELVRCAAETFGRLDILVNNAAGFTEGDVLDAADDDWEELFRTKVLGYVRLTRAAEPLLAAAPTAAVLNIAGILSVQPRPGAGPASVVNSGVVAYSRIAARRLAPQGIRVNVLSPGAVRGDRFSARIDRHLAEHGGIAADAEKALLASSPSGRPVDLAEIARTAVFLCAPAQTSLIGAHLVLDGGLTT